jgi:hypothetical protein
MHPLVTIFQRWRYLFLLAALLALLVIQPIASAIGIMDSLFDALLVIVMVVLVLALAQDKVWRVVAYMLCIPAAILSLGGHFFTSAAQEASLSIGHAIGALFFVVVAGKIIGSICASQEISLDSIFGAICGYLLLGVAWALAYATLQAASPASFQLSDAMRPQLGHVDSNQSIFIYYSFVTLTTVGYGDVAPVSIPARTLSWVEAITGQLYLAVLIAGLVSALVAKNATTSQRR